MGVRVCAKHRCPNPTDNHYCDQHHKQRRKDSDAHRPSAGKRGYDQTWRATRKAYLTTHPWCEDASGCLEQATDAHHLDGLGPKGPRGHDHSNLQALCGSHHSQVTATMQRGGWNT